MDTQTNVNQEIETKEVDLNTIINDSKNNLENSEQVQPVKRKRRSKKELEETTKIEQEKIAIEQSADLKPVLKMLIPIPFDIAAERTKFEKWSLTDVETELLSTYAEKMIAKYMPAMSESNAVLVTFLTALVTCTGVRYIQYKKWKSDQEKVNV